VNSSENGRPGKFSSVMVGTIFLLMKLFGVTEVVEHQKKNICLKK